MAADQKDAGCVLLGGERFCLSGRGEEHQRNGTVALRVTCNFEEGQNRKTIVTYQTITTGFNLIVKKEEKIFS